jgi:hypothetical protein
LLCCAHAESHDFVNRDRQPVLRLLIGLRQIEN